MFSLARSRYTLALQFVFLAANILGVLFAIIYNASTPDLYPNNAHHKVGWIAAAVAVAQVIISILGHVVGLFRQPQVSSGGRGSESRAFLPVSEASMAERDRIHGSEYAPPGRLSNDSGHGTEPNTESLRSHSFSSSGRASPRMSCDGRKEYAEPDDDLDEDGSGFPTPSKNKPKSSFGRAVGFIPPRVWKGLMVAYDVIDRTILILGFIAFCLGIVAYGRFFVSEKRASALTKRARADSLLLGGPCHLRRPRSLGQGRRLFLAGHLHPWPMERNFRRDGMGTFAMHCHRALR